MAGTQNRGRPLVYVTHVPPGCDLSNIVLEQASEYLEENFVRDSHQCRFMLSVGRHGDTEWVKRWCNEGRRVRTEGED